MSKKIYVITTISKFKMKYAFEADDPGEAYDLYESMKDGDMTEMSQLWLGEDATNHIGLTEDEYIEMFDRDNPYLSAWPKETKLKQVNKGEEDDDIQ